MPKGITLQPPPDAYDGDFAEFPPILDEAELPLPVIAKPACEGSSKGIRNRCLIRSARRTSGRRSSSCGRDYRQPVLVEEFIAGDEVTVGIVGNDPPQPIGIMQMVPKQPAEKFVYSLEVKRDWHEQVEYECPRRSCRPRSSARSRRRP